MICNVLFVPNEFYTRCQRVTVMVFGYSVHAIVSCLVMTAFYPQLSNLTASVSVSY